MNETSVEILEPVWKDNFAAIAMSSSDEYVPYLSVCLQSLVDHTDPNHNYDIIIFERSITDEHKSILTQQIARQNVSLRFVNPMEVISQYDLKFPSHYNLECYFRLTSPLILSKYNKIIFTDVDLIFKRDIKDLYNIEIPNALGACQDLVWCSFCDTPEKTDKEYAEIELELDDPYMYFNTGVMVLNLEYFRQNHISEKLLDMANERMYRILEQDILNKYFKTNITYIDDCWNFPTMNKNYSAFMENAQEEYQQRYQNARKNPGIIHWAGRGKAWLNPEEDLAYKWWQISRKTPFYEVILQRLCKNHVNKLKNQVKYAFGFRKNVLGYCGSKLLYFITFGKTKEHYKNKGKSLKSKIMAGKVLK